MNMNLELSFLVALAAGAACSDAEPGLGTHRDSIIGGHAIDAGVWPDFTAMYKSASSEISCGGTLVAPTIVLTAAHCDFHDLDSVVVGASSQATPVSGEIIPIVRKVSHRTIDLMVVVLARAATATPRPIATGWANLEIADGAPVTMVGFGLTSEHPPMVPTLLQEASATIRDADCSDMTRFPLCGAHRVVAGDANGTACSGDSGGPLYLDTAFGTFLVGLTEGSATGGPCTEGGVFVRPDRFAPEIEQLTGVRLARAPEPTAAPIEVVRGHLGETLIEPGDPQSSHHRYELVRQPRHGRARVDGDGLVRVCASPGVTGDDSLVVEVIDADHPDRAVETQIAIHILDGTPASSCSLDADGGGCRAAPGGSGLLVLLVVVGACVRRTRRFAMIGLIGCGDNRAEVFDAVTIVHDAPVDVWAPPSDPTKCLGQAAPTVAQAQIAIAGGFQEVTKDGPRPIPGVDVRLVRAGVEVASDVADAQGDWTLSAATGGLPLDAVVVATSPGRRPNRWHRGYAFVRDDALKQSLEFFESLLLTPAQFEIFVEATGSTQSPANGAVLVASYECGRRPFHTTVRLERAGVPLAEPKPIEDNAAMFFDVTPGLAIVKVIGDGSPWPDHEIEIVAGTTSSLSVFPGPVAQP